MHRVETFGIPGAGKSTIRQALLPLLKKERRDMCLSIEEAFARVAKRRIDRHFRIPLKLLPDSAGVLLAEKFLNRSLMQHNALCTFLARHGQAFSAFLSSHEFSCLSEEDRRDVISFFFQIGSMYECISGELEGQTVVFFDEGFVQKSFMFVSHTADCGDDTGALHRYLQHVPLPHVLVVLNAEPSVCLERLVGRPRGLTERLKRFSGSQGIVQFLERAEKHVGMVLSWLRENSNVQIIEHHNDEPLQVLIPVLIREIDGALLKSASRTAG